MAKSIKLKNDTYLDSSSVTHNKKKLNDILEGKVLYEGDETNGNITLNDDVSNYNYFEIYFRHQKCNLVMRVSNPSEFSISSICWATSEIIQHAFSYYETNKNIISVINCGYINYSNNAVRNIGTTSPLNIYKVVGY